MDESIKPFLSLRELLNWGVNFLPFIIIYCYKIKI